MTRGKAYRRWKTLSKYITRIRKRLSWMSIKYGEVEVECLDGKKRSKALLRKPRNWKEVDADNVNGAKLLKDTPTQYTDPWKKEEDKKAIKKMREDSRRIILEELNNED